MSKNNAKSIPAKQTFWIISKSIPAKRYGETRQLDHVVLICTATAFFSVQTVECVLLSKTVC